MKLWGSLPNLVFPGGMPCRDKIRESPHRRNRSRILYCKSKNNFCCKCVKTGHLSESFFRLLQHKTKNVVLSVVEFFASTNQLRQKNHHQLTWSFAYLKSALSTIGSTKKHSLSFNNNNNFKQKYLIDYCSTTVIIKNE